MSHFSEIVISFVSPSYKEELHNPNIENFLYIISSMSTSLNVRKLYTNNVLNFSCHFFGHYKSLPCVHICYFLLIRVCYFEKGQQFFVNVIYIVIEKKNVILQFVVLLSMNYQLFFCQCMHNEPLFHTNIYEANFLKQLCT